LVGETILILKKKRKGRETKSHFFKAKENRKLGLRLWAIGTGTGAGHKREIQCRRGGIVCSREKVAGSGEERERNFWFQLIEKASENAADQGGG